jgi:hypothetical protein
MLDEYPLNLRQADQARANFAAIFDNLDFIKAQLVRIPTRMELARHSIARNAGNRGVGPSRRGAASMTAVHGAS